MVSNYLISIVSCWLQWCGWLFLVQ